MLINIIFLIVFNLHFHYHNKNDHDCCYDLFVLLFQGLFLIPELTDFMGFHILEEEVERLTQQLVEEVPSQSRNRKLVQVFDQLSDCLCRVADMVSVFGTLTTWCNMCARAYMD